MATFAAFAFLPFVIAGVTSPPPPPTERAATTVQVVGPVAHVAVDRVVSLASLKVPNTGGLSVFDFALPATARALSVDVTDAGGAEPEAAWNEAAVPLPEGVQKLPVDPASTFRLVFDGGGSRTLVRVRYTYDLPLECDAGRWRLTLPGASDLAPIGASLRLDVRLPAPLRLNAAQIGGERTNVTGRRWHYEGVLAPQTSTSVWLTLAPPRASTAAAAWAMALASGTGHKGAASLGVCRAPAQAPEPHPTLVMAVVDASRSVGTAGLSYERDLVGTFLAALSSDTLFNVVPFNRAASPLFPLARLVTKETLALLDNALVPDRLANGSDVVGALQVARQQLEAERKDNPERAGLLLLVTDGSLPETLEAATLLAASPAVPSAVALVRPDSDEVAPVGAQRLLTELPGHNGGVFRQVAPPNVAHQAQAMARDTPTGDWFDVRWGKTRLAPVLVPGGGVQAQLPSTANARLPQTGVTYRHGGKAHSLKVATEWLPKGWGGSAAGAASTQLPSGIRVHRYPLEPPAEVPLEKGELERSVLRNSLSLAYLPRARACYLNRNAKDARSRDLTGRVRLSLEIERGELLSAAVLSSTLGAPAIERCLVDNAYALVLPRPSGRDAPVQALLNLVFRPTLPEAAPDGGPSALDQEIEILLGPRRVLDPANPGASLPGI